MKRVLFLAGVMGLALAQGAQAADMSVQASPFWLPPVNATPDWSGPYIGFNGGYGFGSGSVTGSFFGPIVAVGDPLGFSTAGNPVGAVFGGQVGYNWQQASVVFGVEGDFDAATLTASGNTVSSSLAVRGRRSAFKRPRMSTGYPPFVLGSVTLGGLDWSILLAAERGRMSMLRP